MQRRQRGAGASRHPPRASDAYKLLADLLLRSRGATAGRLHLDENRPLRNDDHHVRKTATHASLLRQKAIQKRRRPIFQRSPKRGRGIKIPLQQPSQRGVLPPLLTPAPTPSLGSLAQADPLPWPGPSNDGAVGVACGTTPAISEIAFPARNRVCNPPPCLALARSPPITERGQANIAAPTSAPLPSRPSDWPPTAMAWWA